MGVPRYVLELAATLTHDQRLTEGGREVRLLFLATREVTRLAATVGRDVGFAEFFCGVGRCAAAVRRDGGNAVTFDRAGPHGDKEEDATVLAGLLWMGLLVCSIVVNGVCWFAPECSTWGWMARGHSHRSIDAIHGDDDRADVHEANITALVVQLA